MWELLAEWKAQSPTTTSGIVIRCAKDAKPADHKLYADFCNHKVAASKAGKEIEPCRTKKIWIGDEILAAPKKDGDSME
eukprot:5219694-Karenia_brevis.AAC.1